MIKKLLVFLLLAVSVALSQNFVSVTAAQVYSGSSLLPAGTILFQAVGPTGLPVSYQVGGGGQQITYPTICSIVNGAITGSCQVANTSLTNPVNVCFLVTVKDNANRVVLGGTTTSGYQCVQPATSNTWCSSGTCNFDTYVPNTAGIPTAKIPPPTSFSLGGVFAASCTGGQVQTGTDSNGRPICGAVVGTGTLNPSGTPTVGQISAWVDATHLGNLSSPSPCVGGQFAIGITSTGSSICSTPAGSGNVSNTGTPSANQLALWVNSTVIQGVNTLPSSAMPVLNGDVTTPGGSLTATVVGVNGATVGASWGVVATNGSKQLINQTGTITNSTSGNAGTATALAATPTACPGGQFATGIQANGTAICSTPTGTGTLNPFGAITANQIAQWVDGTHLQSLATTGTGNGVLAAGPTITNAILATPSFSGTATGNISGNSGTTNALSSLPSACSGNQFAQGILANGNALCGTPAGSGNVSNSGSPTANQIALWVDTVTLKAVTVGGDGTLSGSGTLIVTKTNGTNFGPLATQSTPCLPSQGCLGSSVVPSVGNLAIGDGTKYNPTAASGDCTVNSSGVFTCTKTGGVSFSPLATQAVPATVAQGGTGSTGTPAAGNLAIGDGTKYNPTAASGDCAVNSAGVFTCTKTSAVSFAASATTDATNASNIASGTLNASRLPGTAVQTTQANSYTAGNKQTFVANATTAGLNLAGVTADPSGKAAGDIWNRSDLNLLKYWDGATAHLSMWQDTALALAQTPLTTAGDVLYITGTPALARRAISGTNGALFFNNSGLPDWNADFNITGSGSGSVANYTGTIKPLAVQFTGTFGVGSTVPGTIPAVSTFCASFPCGVLALGADGAFHISPNALTGGAGYSGDIVTEPNTPCTGGQTLTVTTPGTGTTPTVWGCGSGSAGTWDAISAPVGDQTLPMSTHVTNWNWGSTPATTPFALSFPSTLTPTYGMTLSASAALNAANGFLSLQEASCPIGVVALFSICQAASPNTNPWGVFTNGTDNIQVSKTGVLSASGNDHVNADQVSGVNYPGLPAANNMLPVVTNLGTATVTYRAPNDLESYSYAAGGGTANAQTVTLVPAPTLGLTAGTIVRWTPTAANTGATTLKVNTLTVKNLTKCGTTALAANDLLTTIPARAVYDGTEYQLENPQAAGCTVPNTPVTFNGQAVSLGNSGNVNNGATAHTVAVNEGNGNLIAGAGPGTTGQVLESQGSSADPIMVSYADLTPTGYVIGTGTAQAQVVTLAPAATSLTAGLTIKWKPAASNTGAAPTVAVNGLTAKNITKCGTSPVIAADVSVSAVAVAVYDGTGFELQNPQAVGCGTSANGGAGTTGSTGVGIALTTSTAFAPLYGQYGTVITTEANAQVAFGAPTAISQLQVNLGTAAGGAQTVTFTLRDNGVDQAVTCTVPNSGTTCTDTTHSYTAAAGHLLDWKVVLSATTLTSNIGVGSQVGNAVGTYSGNTTVAVSANGTLNNGNLLSIDANHNAVDSAIPTTSAALALYGHCASTVGTGNGTFFVMSQFNQSTSQSCGVTQATEAIMPVACSAKRLSVNLGTAGAVVGSGVAVLYKNGVATALTCTTGTGTSCQDTTHTVAFNGSSDTYSLRIQSGQASDTIANVRMTAVCQ